MLRLNSPRKHYILVLFHLTLRHWILSDAFPLSFSHHCHHHLGHRQPTPPGLSQGNLYECISNWAARLYMLEGESAHSKNSWCSHAPVYLFRRRTFCSILYMCQWRQVREKDILQGDYKIVTLLCPWAGIALNGRHLGSYQCSQLVKQSLKKWFREFCPFRG